MGGASLRKVEAWTATEGQGPKVTFTTIGRHKKHLPIPAESLKLGEGLPLPEQQAAQRAQKQKVHAAQAEVTKQNPAFPAAVAVTEKALAALAEAQDFCLRVLRGHKSFELPKSDPSHPSVRLVAVAVAGVKATATAQFQIATGKGKPTEGQKVAETLSGGLSDLLSSAFDEGPPPVEGNDPATAGLSAMIAAETPEDRAPAQHSAAPPATGAPVPPPTRIPTSEDLWNDLLPDASAPLGFTPPPGTTEDAAQATPIPAPPDSGTQTPPAAPTTGAQQPGTPSTAPRKDLGILLTFPPRARHG